MMFRSYRPAPPLADFIDHFWLYDDYSFAYAHEKIFPTGAFDLVFNLRSDDLRIYEHGSSSLSLYPGALVSGSYSGFFVTERTEGSSAMGAHFRPGGAFPFLGVSAYELTNTHLDLAAIWGRQAEEIREQLAEARSSRQRFRLLEKALLSRLRRPLQHHPAVSLGLHGLRPAEQQPLVRNLAREAGLSDRRFIDVFRSEVGLNPKLFNRVQRFQGVLVKVHQVSAPEWEQLAIASGYFDQSHMIRDFLEFSGFSPTDYLQRYKELRHQGLHVKLNHLPVSEQRLQFCPIQPPAPFLNL